MSGGRIVVVSTFPPLRCGIAQYAAQHVEWLRKRGEEVLTIGHPGSQADAVTKLCGGRNVLRVLSLSRERGVVPAHSRLAVHWHDDHYLEGGFSERIPTALALSRLFRSFGEVELICHETYGPEAVTSPPKQVMRSLYRFLRRRAWNGATTLAFHSEAERRKAEAAHGGRFPDGKVLIRDHSAFLFKYRDVDQATARRELGVPSDCFLFLCIGFLAPHKGFHLAMEALQAVDSPLVRLAVVGSPREGSLHELEYVRTLERLARRDERILLRTEFVSDETYDTWNAAADVVVAPYTEVFSSSVVARAKLFGKRVIVTATGGLPKQVDVTDRVVADENELRLAMVEMAAGCECVSP